MDSPTDFDDEEGFFASYDIEHASAARLELDAEEGQPPSHEELAHLARFRKPVAVVVTSMALLSMVALGMRGSLQHDTRRELVARYESALAAPTLTATEAVEPIAAPEAASALVPEAFSAFLVETLSALVPEAFPAANAALPPLTISAADPVLEPAPPDTALTAASIQPDNPVSAFISVSTQMCLRPTESDYRPIR